jgi:hypothetical protein
MNITIYGMYTSSDPTCQTGLNATIALSSTPTTANLVTGPTLGSGPVANPINCVIFILKNQVGYVWPAGTYTSTSSGSSDSVCNTGGTLPQKICNHGETLSFPSQIVADAASEGLTLPTGCSNGGATGNEVVPIFISTDSTCVGQAALDPAQCTSGGTNTNVPFQAPTASGDSSHGCKLTAPAAGASSYTLVIDPAGSIGYNGGTCQSIAPPIFSLR